MKPIFAKSALIVAALVIAACSATPVRRSFKESWNDTLTAEKIRYKLMKDKEVKKSRMHVEVFRGQVTLTGRAVNDAEKARAETLAKSVKHVTGVENYVHVVGDGKSAPVAAVAQAATPATPAAPVKAAGTVIEEKTIVVEREKIKVSADDIPATVPTVRVGTGTGQSVTAVTAASAPARQPVGPKVVAKPTKSTKPLAKETRLATVKKAPVVVTPSAKPVQKEAPVVHAPAKEVPASKAVGQSKTGLPWDGEIYEDDASRVSSVTAASKAIPKAAAATRTSVATPPPAPAPAANPSPATGDDLAKEAAQELEKLRQKK